MCVAAHDYSASAIARAVEDCDAHLINLNVLADRPSEAPGQCLVALRVDHRNASAVARSLERYGYRILDLEHAPGADSDTMRERVRELIHYLDV